MALSSGRDGAIVYGGVQGQRRNGIGVYGWNDVRAAAAAAAFAES